MSDSRAKELLGYSFLVVFADDEAITEDELHMMERLALQDDVIDSEEKDILTRVFKRIDEKLVAEKVLQEINAFKKQYNIE